MKQKEILSLIRKETGKNFKYFENINWYKISMYEHLSENFIREFKNYVNWTYISKHQKLSENFIREFKDYVNWGLISFFQELSEYFIREFKDKVDWVHVSKRQKLSEDFIFEFSDSISWDSLFMNEYVTEEFILNNLNLFDKYLVFTYRPLSIKSLSVINKDGCFNAISKFQVLTHDFIREHKHDVDWENISKCQILSEDFIREFINEVNWYCISAYQKLSENFIREFKDRVNWTNISKHQKLSEDFIREFQNEVYWDYISKYQKLSEKFIIEFKEQISLEYICSVQSLSSDFILKHKDDLLIDNIVFFQKINEDTLKILKTPTPKNNWNYKTVNFKKKKVKNSGLYECYDDHFIAYKNVRRDRYSHYNFQYQYLKGGVYECHCDCTNAENSFGLSAWTKKQAKTFKKNGLIVKVKIKYEDVGRVVHNGGKIRCSKFEVLD